MRSDTIKVSRKDGRFEYNEQPLCDVVDVEDGTFSIVFSNSTHAPEHGFETHKEACLYVWANIEEILSWRR